MCRSESVELRLRNEEMRSTPGLVSDLIRVRHINFADTLSLLHNFSIADALICSSLSLVDESSMIETMLSHA
jgi:hypothetical protein